MALPPRPFLTEDQIRALSPAERAVAIAEWSSFNERLRREQEQRPSHGPYRGATRARGRARGRGYYGYQPYQPYQPKFPSTATGFNIERAPDARSVQARSSTEIQPSSTTPCSTFTATGVCKRNRCPHVHDPDKTAICKPYLFKGNCPNGGSCPLSHEASPNRSPHCIHFQNENCTKDDCQYAHVHVNPAAPLCEAFARSGYCEKGAQCVDRHAFGECPDFTNNGVCELKGCRLSHIVHAGRLRKAAGTNATVTPAESPKDSPATPKTPPEDENTHALTQQDDFVPFDP